MVKDRSSERFQNSTINHTEDGAIIFTDCWKAYDGLDAKVVEHYKVNHKENFVSHQRRHVDEPEEERPLVTGALCAAKFQGHVSCFN